MKHESAIELILDLEEEYNINAKAWYEFQLQEEVFHQLQVCFNFYYQISHFKTFSYWFWTITLYHT